MWLWELPGRASPCQNLQGLELWKLAWFLQGFPSIRFTESVKLLLRERERQVLITLFIVSTNQTAWGKKVPFKTYIFNSSIVPDKKLLVFKTGSNDVLWTISRGQRSPNLFVVFSSLYGVNTPITIGFKLLGVAWLTKVLNIQQSALSGRYKSFQHNHSSTVMLMDSSPLGIIKAFLKT